MSDDYIFVKNADGLLSFFANSVVFLMAPGALYNMHQSTKHRVLLGMRSAGPHYGNRDSKIVFKLRLSRCSPRRDAFPAKIAAENRHVVPNVGFSPIKCIH